MEQERINQEKNNKEESVDKPGILERVTAWRAKRLMEKDSLDKAEQLAERLIEKGSFNTAEQLADRFIDEGSFDRAEQLMDRLLEIETEMKRMKDEVRKNTQKEIERVSRASGNGASAYIEKILDCEVEGREVMGVASKKIKFIKRNIYPDHRESDKLYGSGDIEEENNEANKEKREREINEPLLREAGRRRNLILEKKGLLELSREDFEEYFVSEEFDFQVDMRQKNVGNCYLIAAIHAMSCSSHFEMIIRSSIKHLPDKSWEVRMPLMSRNSEVITVKSQDLMPQSNENFGEPMKWSDKIDRREVLLPVKAKEGLKVLEAAYMKYKFETVDRLSVHGGVSVDALGALCGSENFFLRTVTSFVYDEKRKESKGTCLDVLSGKDKEYLDYFLKNFDPEVHIAAAGSRHIDESTSRGRILKELNDRKKEEGLVYIRPGHAYSISKVDPENETVTIVNPHDTLEPIKMTFKDFKREFSQLSIARVNSAKLLRNMDTITEEVM